MKLTIERADLASAVATVSHAVAGKSAVAILSMILLEARGDRLWLTGTDLTTSLRTSVDAMVEIHGAIALDPRPLAEWLGSVPDGAITLDVDLAKWRATFRAGGARITLSGLDPEDYPLVPGMDPNGETAAVPAQTLKGMLARTVVAASPDANDSRPVLHGVRLELAPHHIDLAAADGFRMTRDRADVETGMGEVVTAIVPRPCAAALIGVIGDASEAIDLQLTGHQRSLLSARIGTVEWGARLIEGVYPDVERLIRRTHPVTVQVARASLRAAIRGSRTLSADSNGVVWFAPNADGESLRVSAQSSEYGDADRVIAAHVEGDGSTIPRGVAMDWKVVDQALGVMLGDTVVLQLEGELRPVNVVDTNLPGHIAVLTPIAVGGAS